MFAIPENLPSKYLLLTRLHTHILIMELLVGAVL